MNTTITKAEAVRRAGGIRQLSELLGISRQAVHKWDEIPALQRYRLKEIKPGWFRSRAQKQPRNAAPTAAAVTQ